MCLDVWEGRDAKNRFLRGSTWIGRFSVYFPICTCHGFDPSLTKTLIFHGSLFLAQSFFGTPAAPGSKC